MGGLGTEEQQRRRRDGGAGVQLQVQNDTRIDRGKEAGIHTDRADEGKWKPVSR